MLSTNMWTPAGWSSPSCLTWKHQTLRYRSAIKLQWRPYLIYLLHPHLIFSSKNIRSSTWHTQNTPELRSPTEATTSAAKFYLLDRELILEELKTAHRVPRSRAGKSTSLTKKAVGEMWQWPIAPNKQESMDYFSESVVEASLLFLLT